MSSLALAVSRLPLLWVAVYTLGLPSAQRKSRRREIRSDTYEHVRDPSFGESPAALAWDILRSLISGLPDDLRWRATYLSVWRTFGQSLVVASPLALIAGFITFHASHQLAMAGLIVFIVEAATAGALAGLSLQEVSVNSVLLQSTIPNPTYRGKVRETYDLGDRMLIVATDRISAFDVVLPTGIPGKGAVLSQMAAWWFERTANVVPNHLIRLADGTAADDLPFELPQELFGRSTIARKADRVDVECIVRGYISGSAWAEYQKYGTVNGVRMPKGMQESEQFPEPLFTPTTKAETGHDEPMTYSDLVQEVGPEAANVLRLRSIALYNFAAEYARSKGIIIADTKFEFGYIDGELHVIDEILTPDSSRFWAVEDYKSGGPQPSFDKQYVRDWLAKESGWDRQSAPPELPDDVVRGTSERYREAYRRLTGNEVR